MNKSAQSFGGGEDGEYPIGSEGVPANPILLTR